MVNLSPDEIFDVISSISATHSKSCVLFLVYFFFTFLNTAPAVYLIALSSMKVKLLESDLS